MYLTFDEYKSLGFSKIEDEQEFASVEHASEVLVDDVTNQYYIIHDMESDPDAVRVKFFKKAMALQCEYLHDTGATSLYELRQANVKSISIGRTSLSTDGISGSNTKGVYTLSMDLLALAGLLYRGVDHT